MNNNDTLFRFEDLDEVNLAPQPVTCLGITFESDDARRSYFKDELRKRLPELRANEGFPIGEDDDIINLSDPPYYTVCPNPWINNFIEEWEANKASLLASGERSDKFTVQTPYATSINEGKNHPIYNAHSYHTKVPHYVIMNYYLHYTQPGDIVLDNFGGTGMAGVAANFCSTPDAAARRYFDEKWKKENGHLPKWGTRHCIIGDLAPICSFITYNFTNSVDYNKFKSIAERLLSKLEDEYSWMYETKDTLGISSVNYYIWSEIQECHECGHEFVYWDVAVDLEYDKVQDPYLCPVCGTSISKNKALKAKEAYYDGRVGETYTRKKFVPVYVNYTTADNKRHERKVNEYDLQVLKRIDALEVSQWYPTYKMMGIGENWGDTWRAGTHVGFQYIHNFYSKRNLVILARLYELIKAEKCSFRIKQYLLSWFNSSQSRLHMMNRYAAQHHRHVGPLANTMYVSGTPTEISPFYFLKSKIKDNILDIPGDKNVVNQVASATNCGVKDNSIDYIFTDPPFGANIMYSELNFMWESWLHVRTNNKEEAICNKSQQKGFFEYEQIMTECFKEYYRILKPGKWMTVEFSNTSASVWNSIQHSLQSAGFIIASVSDLSKGRGGLHGIVGVVAVNQDLAITCYKPSEKLSNKYSIESLSSANIWDFISELLEHLPVHLLENDSTTAIVERSPKILYDRLVSYYVQHGYSVPIDAPDFQKGLRERFIERDGMFFTASQALEYEEKKAQSNGFKPMSLFIGSEADGIEWLNRKLDTPKTYQELQPDWMKDMVSPKKGDILPGLDVILEENFIQDASGRWCKPDPENASHLEQLRGRRLMKEFNLYLEAAQKPKAKRLKEARLEVLRYGFKECNKAKNYKDIVLVGDHIEETLLMEDEQLLMYYLKASKRV